MDNFSFIQRLGESCTHIGAILFKIEAAVRSGFTKRACTDEPCRWNDDFVKKIKPAEISNIKFYNSEKKDDMSSSNFPGALTEPTCEEKRRFLEKQFLSGNPPVVLHAFSDFCSAFIPKAVPPNRSILPSSLRGLFSPENSSKSTEELSYLIDTTINNMKLDTKTISYIYEVTKRQNDSAYWHEIRTGRITASVAHDILHTDIESPAVSLIARICQSQMSSMEGIASLQWGREHEKEAISEYSLFAESEHSECEIQECGLKICQDLPFIGATPDGIFSCKCHPSCQLIEVKCPYSMRDTDSIEDAIKQSKFFIDQDKQLKKNNRYFTQVQLQLFVFGLKECIFIVWTPKWMFHTTIARDDIFIDSMVKHLTCFYKKHIMKELLTRDLQMSSSQPNALARQGVEEKLFCVCKSKHSDDESWIGCDAVSCKTEWFHTSCMKIKRVPKGNWYCPDCRKDKKRKK